MHCAERCVGVCICECTVLRGVWESVYVNAPYLEVCGSLYM